MSRSLAFLSTLPLLAVAAQAQCLGGVTGTAVPLTPTNTWPADDEGISAAVPLGFVFPMAGTLGGGLTDAFISSNGEIYLTNATYGLVTVVGGVPLYGFNTLAEMRGTAGANPRICGFAADHEAGSGGTWGIFVDTSVANEATFRFHDLTDFGGVLSCDWSVRLLASGAMEFSYGATMPNGTSSFVSNIAGVSIGNAVGTGTEPSLDLTSNQDSGALGLLYEAWGAAVPNDLAQKTILIVPNGLGGFSSTVTCTGAYHETYGAGCYSIPAIASEAFYEFFANPAATSSQLPGTSITLTPTGTGYAVVNGGGAYVTPTGAATILALTDDTEVSVTPSIAFPHVSGPIPTIAVSSNGNINMAASPSGNSTTAYGTVASLLTATVASFRSNGDYDPGNSPGKIKSEEAANILFITWENVERYSVNGTSDRLQFQLNLLSGVVVIVWDAMANSGAGTALTTVVGYTPGGGSVDGGSIDLATALPIVTSPDTSAVAPLTLSASPPPVFAPAGPSVPITYQVNNLRDLSPFVPGFYLATLVFSFNPPIIPGGLDLTLVGIDAPGCNLLVGSLDVLYNINPVAASHGEIVVVPQPLSPGTTFYVQAANFLIPNSLPNGQNGFGLIVSNGVKSKFDLF